MLLKYVPIIKVFEIKQKSKLNKKFPLQCFSVAAVRKFAKNLPSDKTTAGEIPVNVLKILKLVYLN